MTPAVLGGDDVEAEPPQPRDLRRVVRQVDFEREVVQRRVLDVDGIPLRLVQHVEPDDLGVELPHPRAIVDAEHGLSETTEAGVHTAIRGVQASMSMTM